MIHYLNMPRCLTATPGVSGAACHLFALVRFLRFVRFRRAALRAVAFPLATSSLANRFSRRHRTFVGRFIAVSVLLAAARNAAATVHTAACVSTQLLYNAAPVKQQCFHAAISLA